MCLPQKTKDQMARYGWPSGLSALKTYNTEAREAFIEAMDRVQEECDKWGGCHIDDLEIVQDCINSTPPQWKKFLLNEYGKRLKYSGRAAANRWLISEIKEDGYKKS